jgi:hypothetical protein
MTKKIATIKITTDFVNKLQKAISAALEYEEKSNWKRKLGITGEVGEILVCYYCRMLGLRLVADPRAEGFDAVDRYKNKVEIKTRRSESNNEPKLTGRMSRLSKHKFDYALLAFLNRKYELIRVWKLPHNKVIKLKYDDRRGPNLKSFIDQAGNPIYSQEKRTRKK